MHALGLLLLTTGLAALDLASTDRLAMADRLFNKSRYAEALREYVALSGNPDLETPDLAYRLAECYRATGDRTKARKSYLWLRDRYPASRFAPRARLMAALMLEGGDATACKQEREELLALDSDRLPVETRAAALYYLGVMDQDAAKLQRSIELDPKGRYVQYARLRRAALLAGSGNEEEKRKAVGLLTDVAFDPKSPFAEDALYLAGATDYTGRKYGEAANLLHRYLQKYPQGGHRADALRICAWCDYLERRYADVLRLCEQATGEDCVYLRAAAHYALGESELAEKGFDQYLSDFPQGRYRKEAELPLARLRFAAAQKSGDRAGMLENAKRAAALGRSAADQLRLGWAQEQGGEPETASATYEALARTYPATREAAEALYLKAMIDLRANAWDRAELALKEALEGKLEKSRVAEATYWRGICALRLDHTAEGIRLLKEALRGGLDLNETREARLAIADNDFNEGRVEEAKAAYRDLVEKHDATDRMSAQKILRIGKLVGSRTCAKALTQSENAEWRQSGWVLLGDLENTDHNYQAAIEAYRKAVAEPPETSELPHAMLRLGVLECDNGDHASAEKHLVKAIDLNRSNVTARAEAYLALARTAKALNNMEKARGYATVVSSLFEQTPFAAEAKKMLEELK